MPKISRRTALTRGGQAVAVAAAFPVIHNIAAEAAEADAEMLDLEHQLAEARETSARFWKSVSGYSLKEEPAIEEKARPLDDRVVELERQIAEVPAQGLAGVGVKLRLAARWIKVNKGNETEDLCALSAHDAVERLLIAGKNAG